MAAIVPNGHILLNFWVYFVIFFCLSTSELYIVISLSFNFLDFSLHNIEIGNQVYRILF